MLRCFSCPNVIAKNDLLLLLLLSVLASCVFYVERNSLVYDHLGILSPDIDSLFILNIQLYCVFASNLHQMKNEMLVPS